MTYPGVGGSAWAAPSDAFTRTRADVVVLEILRGFTPGVTLWAGGGVSSGHQLPRVSHSQTEAQGNATCGFFPLESFSSLSGRVRQTAFQTDKGSPFRVTLGPDPCRSQLHPRPT